MVRLGVLVSYFLPDQITRHTDFAGKYRFVVDVGLDPGHELLNVRWGGHLSWTLVVLAVLPKVLEPAPR